MSLYAMGHTSAALVWGISVDIVHLLNSIDAFRKSFSAIQILRLCNKFARDKKSPISRLPKELITIIEEMLLHLHRQEEQNSYSGWARKYCCYEGSCRPSHHLNHPDCPLYGCELHAHLVADAQVELCEKNPAWRTDRDFDFPEDFEDLVKERVAQRYDEDGYEWIREERSENKMEWDTNVGRHLDAGINKMVRKYFGLNIFVKHENLSKHSANYLRNNVKRFSHPRSNPKQATICYLAMPTQAAQWSVLLAPPFSEGDSYYGESANAMLVDHASLISTEARRQRFARAMRRLALKPSVHPSQFKHMLSAEIPGARSSELRQMPFRQAKEKLLSTEETARMDAATTKRIHDLEMSEWPKLMLLVDQEFYDF